MIQTKLTHCGGDQLLCMSYLSSSLSSDGVNNTKVICRSCLELPLNVLQTTEYHNKQISNKSVALGFLDVVCQISL